MTDTTTGGPHEALAVFLGSWHAEGVSYGGPTQTPADPHAEPAPWRSIHTARWHTGNYFVIQDERANGPFDTLSILGWDRDTERYFARTVENHGYTRDYTMTVDRRTWTLTGENERATFEFSADGRTQTVTWEWRPRDAWLPLCDRVAHRID
ncbi:Protein of unknown function [Paraoerskovia marina]|uniref:DUF1579 domain-containing protein n=1 Tax=Paraoerskovia marina TaxID=545619 RepID=A0A1H1SPR5_9CELL|nr:DUF1579 family protein [Paraoerskovia marina]SDS49982.1 Protein of unknown function [Paraoerskovia marina]